MLLAAPAGRYDYHRDELYFRELGGHSAWGYVEEQGLPIRVCRGPLGSWRELWPRFQHLD